MAYTYGRQIGADLNDFKRSLGALVGIAQGLVCDQQLTDKKIHFLHDWLSENDAISTRWPGDVLYTRVRAVLADGSITAEERQYLIDTLLKLVGSDGPDLPKATHATALAHDVVDRVTFDEKSFCLTGNFVYGPVESCESAIKKRGGDISASVKAGVTYLVIGSLGSAQWKHGSFGRKVEKAMECKRNGLSIFVIQEERWARSLDECPLISEEELTLKDVVAQDYVSSETSASDSLVEALESRVAALKALGWEVSLAEKEVGLFDHFKNGKVKKTAAVGVMFCEEPEVDPEFAEDAAYERQFRTRRPWYVFSPGIPRSTSYKDMGQAVKLFLIQAHKHAPLQLSTKH
jgi:hypothetical protein